MSDPNILIVIGRANRGFEGQRIHFCHRQRIEFRSHRDDRAGLPALQDSDHASMRNAGLNIQPKSSSRSATSFEVSNSRFDSSGC